MRSLLITALSLCAVGCRPAASEAPADAASKLESAEQAPGSDARWSYEIRIDEALATMQVGLCIEGQLPRRLIAGPEAIGFVTAASVRGGPALERDGRSLKIENLGAHGCVDIEIDLERAASSGGRDSARHGDTLMLAPDRWLWYPGAVPKALDARARFELPKGVAATVPWPAIDPGSPEAWRSLDRTSFGWNAWIALGRYEPLRFTAAESEFEVAVLDGEREFSDAGVEAWLRIAAETSAELYGRFPRDRVAVVVVPASGWGDDPVVFGMARRGGGGSVMLVVDESAADHELPGEWVAVHELLHLGMPLIKEPWMSEGLVTYYTQVLRARRGLLDHKAALEQLAAGFEDRPNPRTLESASANMRKFGGYRRVYWGGAAAAFDLDVTIRSASQNRRSLDDLILLMGPLLADKRRFAADDLLSRMDQEVARWHAAGELSREISCSKIVGRHLRAKSTPADVQALRGIAVDAQSSHLRLLADPIDQVRVRTGLLAPKLELEGGPQ